MEQLLIIIFTTGDLLHPFDSIKVLPGYVIDFYIIQGVIGTNRDIDYEERDLYSEFLLFQVTHYLVPFGMAAADVIHINKVRGWPFTTKVVLVEQDRTPLISHISAKVAGKALTLSSFLKPQGMGWVMSHSRSIWLAGQRVDIITETHGNGVELPGPTSIPYTALVLGISEIPIVLLSYLFSLPPAFKLFGLVLLHCHFSYPIPGLDIQR